MSKKPTVLCVDDQAPNLKIRTMLLEQFGCEAIGVEDEQSALQIISARRIDLMVIDYHLARGETGDNLARDVRVVRPDIKLIMLTGDTSLPDNACTCVDAVLIKGTSNPGMLFDLIEKLVPDAELHPRKRMLVSDPSKNGEKEEKAS
jgi:CheY-like chemotaxis protein